MRQELFKRLILIERTRNARSKTCFRSNPYSRPGHVSTDLPLNLNMSLSTLSENLNINIHPVTELRVICQSDASAAPLAKSDVVSILSVKFSGLISGGNQMRFSPLNVIQQLSSLRPQPTHKS